jgi:hypothetical protein
MSIHVVIFSGLVLTWGYLSFFMLRDRTNWTENARFMSCSPEAWIQGASVPRLEGSTTVPACLNVIITLSKGIILPLSMDQSTRMKGKITFVPLVILASTQVNILDCIHKMLALPNELSMTWVADDDDDGTLYSSTRGRQNSKQKMKVVGVSPTYYPLLLCYCHYQEQIQLRRRFWVETNGSSSWWWVIAIVFGRQMAMMADFSFGCMLRVMRVLLIHFRHGYSYKWYYYWTHRTTPPSNNRIVALYQIPKKTSTVRHLWWFLYVTYNFTMWLNCVTYTLYMWHTFVTTHSIVCDYRMWHPSSGR